MKRILLFAAVLAAVCGCEKPESGSNQTGGETPEADKVSVSAKNHDFKAEGGTFQVVVESSADWTLSPEDYSWIRPDITKGKDGAKVTFTADPNTETAKRESVTFTFVVGKAKATFTAGQAGTDEPEPEPEPEVEFELMNPSDSELEFSVDGGPAMITLKTTVETSAISYTLSEGASWVTQVVMMNSQVGIAVSPNQGAARTATLTLSTPGAKDIVITIKQAGTGTEPEPEPEPGDGVNVVSLDNAQLYSNWPAPEPFTDMTEFTAECLFSAGTFYKGNNPDENINTLFGREGQFIVRVIGSKDASTGTLEAVFTNNGESKITASEQLDINKWYHVAVTFDGGTASIYVNGKQVGNGSTNGMTAVTLQTGEWTEETNWSSKRNFYIGFSVDHRRCLKGNMAEVRIWNKSLSASELAAEGHFLSVDAGSDGLVAYWKFDEGEGTTAKDATSNGNHLYGHTGVKDNGNGGFTVAADGIQWTTVEEITVQ